jgi:hypothetical protein
MKKLVTRAVIALVVCALVGGSALAKSKVKVKSQTITFGADFVVGSTLVQKGTYVVSFNEMTKELIISTRDKKDRTIVAKTIAHLEKREGRSLGLEVIMAQKGANQALVRLAFPGESQSIVLSATEAAHN